MSRKLPAQFELKIEKLANSGEGVGFLEGKEINVFGAFPEELILARPISRKKKVWKAELLEVLKKSEGRRAEKESHYLSCSPWQTISEKKQLEYKKGIVIKAFKKEHGDIFPNPEIVASKEKYHYRNKIEFSFTEIDGVLHLAFHKRYRFGLYSELFSCCLAAEKINKVSQAVLSQLRKRNIKKEQLKNLLIRYSIKEDKCLVALFVVDKSIKPFSLTNDDIVAWHIIYSDPLSPFIKTTEILFSKGNDFISERIAGINLKYYYDSFFQINPSDFEAIIDFLKINIKKNKILLDLYSGVGTIGLSLAKSFEKIYLVEFDERASRLSLENASLNKIFNVKVYGGEAEKQELNRFLAPEDTLIVDPPRSGMHPKAIKKILDILPFSFIYVSCNPFTQVKDIEGFLEKYNILSWRLFDLYPQTPHLESVIIFEKK